MLHIPNADVTINLIFLETVFHFFTYLEIATAPLTIILTWAWTG